MDIVLKKWGNSVGIKIPKLMMEKLYLHVNDTLTCTISGDKIVLQKKLVKEKPTMEKLFENYDGKAEDVIPLIFEIKGNERW